MKAERLQRIEELFHDVAELEPEARADFLNEVCADNDGLRAEIEALLRADAEAPEFIISSAPVITSRSSAPPQAGERIGQYRLLREIGRGGMGVVWLAERDDGRFDQRVAIKVIKRGMDTDEVSRRFARERRILAQLSHPNIARLLDGGETSDGRPWFALEYVEGERLDRYCENRNPGLVERLELFRQICAAVQYAHQNLVIHRDLKPGNILVTAEGEPKLLDFGIAKLLDPGDEITGLTETGQRVMTMDYASPEQVGAGVVTTATDVYSLGVILYELISGRRPYDLTNRPYHEITRVICEQEPRPPSRADASPETAGWRDKLASDLDNIALKALGKEPERRYASAAELAEDIRRYLAGLPVGASGDTFTYRAAKFVKRNKRAVAAVVAVILALVIGLVAAMWQSAIARRERDNAQAINQSFRDLLMKAAPGHPKGPDVKFIDLLEEIGKQVDENPRTPPEFRNDVHFTLGLILIKRGDFNAAEPHVRTVSELSLQMLGENHQRTINSVYHLGLIEWHKGNHEAALGMIRQAVDLTRLHQPESGSLPHMLLDLGGRLGNRGKIDEAEKLILEARERFLKLKGEENQYAAANGLCNLGNLCLENGQPDRAEKYYLEFLEQTRQLPAKFQANEASFRLGVIAYIRGDYRKAEKLIEEVERMFSRRLDGGYPQVADFLYYLSSIHCRWKNYQRAESEARRALEICRRQLAPGDARTVVAMGQLSKVLISSGQTQKAAPYLQEAIGSIFAAPGRSAGYWTTGASLLGECLMSLKRFDEAERILKESYAAHQAECVKNCPGRVEARQRLAKLYEVWGKPDQAARFRG